VNAFQRVRQLPAIIRFAGAASLVLIVGSLAPWISFSGDFADGEYASGVATIPGGLCVIAGGLVIFLLSQLVARGRKHDSGAVAALGLLVCGLIAVTGIRYHGDEYSLDWGIWLSAGAGVALLLAGLALLRFEQTSLPPPD
jgi:hypothetical protein